MCALCTHAHQKYTHKIEHSNILHCLQRPSPGPQTTLSKNANVACTPTQITCSLSWKHNKLKPCMNNICISHMKSEVLRVVTIKTPTFWAVPLTTDIHSRRKLITKT